MSLDTYQLQERSCQVNHYFNQIKQILNAEDTSLQKWMNLIERSFRLILSEIDKLNEVRHFMNIPYQIKQDQEIIDYMIIQHLLQSLEKYKSQNPDILTTHNHFITIYLEFTKQFANLQSFILTRKQIIFKSLINDLKSRIYSNYVHQQYIKEWYNVVAHLKIQNKFIESKYHQKFFLLINKIEIKMPFDIPLYNLTINDIQYSSIQEDLFKQIEQFQELPSEAVQFFTNEFLICEKFRKIKEIIQFLQKNPQSQEFYDDMFCRINLGHMKLLKEEIIDESKILLKKLQSVDNIDSNNQWKHFALNFSFGSVAILFFELIQRENYIEKIIQYYTQRRIIYNNQQIFDFLLNYFVSNSEQISKKITTSPECALATLNMFKSIIDNSLIFDINQFRSSLQSFTFYQIKLIQDILTTRIPIILDLILIAQSLNKNRKSLKKPSAFKTSQEIIKQLEIEVIKIKDQSIIKAMKNIAPKIKMYIKEYEIKQNENGVYDINQKCLKIFYYNIYQEICIKNIIKIINQENESLIKKLQDKKNSKTNKKVKKND